MAECDVTMNDIMCRGEDTTTHCWYCGNAACVECSHIYLKLRGAHRLVRVCNDCAEDNPAWFEYRSL